MPGVAKLTETVRVTIVARYIGDGLVFQSENGVGDLMHSTMSISHTTE